MVEARNGLLLSNLSNVISIIVVALF
jgi:hypothetical protein